MSLSRKNVMRHELIGLEARVINSSDPTLLGVHGRILDETRGTLVIENSSGVKIIPKAGSTYEIKLPDGEKMVIEGQKLIGRPEERVRRNR